MDKFANYKLLSPDNGQEVPFGSVWAGGKAVVFFMRRFGCVLCRHTAFKLSKMAPQLSANGVRLVGIGPEKLGYEEFKQGNFLAGEIYVDESKELYNSIGYKREGFLGILGEFIKGKLIAMNNAAKADGVTGNLKGDIHQLGGVLVLDSAGNKLYEFIQHEATDEPDYAAVAAAAGVAYNKAAVDSVPGPETCDTSCALPAR
uniref:Prostamide/prostaglandin F synthase n=1 Tax=Plectus sambesii TaxID=2011161 RepID=A0A914VH03_9BILA